MSVTHILLADPTCNSALRNAATAAQRMEVVRKLRFHATLILADAMKRIPVEKPSIIAAYRANGMEPVWDLNDNDDAVRFCLTLALHDHSPHEKYAADLLRACVAAEEMGDVPEFQWMQTGRKFTAGRKPKTGSPIRTKVAALLKKNPAMKNPQLWDAVAAKPPRGWQAYENRQGSYLEGPTADQQMAQRRFFNICGEERKKLK